MENLLLNGAVPDDGTGDQLGEEADVQEQIEKVSLELDLAPVQVDHIGEDLEGIKTDADGQGDLRDGSLDRQKTGQVVPEEVQVFEHQQVQNHQDNGHHKHRPSGPRLVPPGRHGKAAQIGHHCGGQHHDHILGLPPGVKEQGEHQEQAVPPGAVFAQVVGDHRQGQEQTEKR